MMNMTFIIIITLWQAFPLQYSALLSQASIGRSRPGNDRDDNNANDEDDNDHEDDDDDQDDDDDDHSVVTSSCFACASRSALPCSAFTACLEYEYHHIIIMVVFIVTILYQS